MTDSGVPPVSLSAAGRSALLLTGAAVVVQAIAFFRQLFLAAEVGATSGLDAVFVALAMPLAMVGVITAGIRPALLPAYAAAKDDSGLPAAKRLVGTVLFWVGLAGLGVSILIWVFAEPLVAVTGPGLAEAGTADDAVRYLRMLAPLAFLGAVSSVYYALAQAEFLFSAIALASIFEAFLVFAVMVLFWNTLALEGLVIGTLLGAVASLLIVLLATLVRRRAPAPRLLARGVGLMDLVRHAAPLSLSAAALQISDMVRRAIASVLLEGGVSVLRFGDSLVRVPFSAIRPAYSTAVYPSLVQASRGPSGTELATATQRILGYALVFFVPLAGLTMAVAPLATSIAYDRGSFDEADLRLTAQVVGVSAPLIVTWTLVPTLASGLNARRKGMALLAGGLLNVPISIVLTVVLGYQFGVVGVAAATTVVSVIVSLFLAQRLLHAEPTISARTLWRTLLKASLAIAPSMIIFGVPIWLGVASGSIGQQIFTLAAVGVVGLVSYYAIAQRIGLDEAGSIIAFGKDAAGRILARIRVGPRRS